MTNSLNLWCRETACAVSEALRALGIAGNFLPWMISLTLTATVIPAATAQHNLVFYNMRQVPQSNLLNPAQMPAAKWFIGFPALAGIRVGAGNTGFTYNQFEDANNKDAYDFDYAGLRSHLRSGTNRVSTDDEVRLLNGGFRVGKGYFNIDIGDVAFASGTYDDEVLGMFDDIQQNRLVSNAISRTYDYRRYDLNGAYYRSYSVGYAHQLLENLQVGGRFRVLQGKGGAWTKNDNVHLRFPGEGDYFEILGRMDLYTAGFGELSEPEASFFLFKGGNVGFALDLGAIYRLSEQVEVSFSAVNLGRLKWKKNVKYQVIDGKLMPSAVDIEDHMNLWGEIGDSLIHGNLAEGVEFRTPLPQRFYIGGNYYLNPNTSVGLLVNPVHFNGVTDVAVALTGNTRISKILSLSAAMAYNRYAAFNLGLGFSLDFGVFQFYAATDNVISVFSWKNARAVQAQFGINFLFGREEAVEKTQPSGLVPTTPEERLLYQDTTALAVAAGMPDSAVVSAEALAAAAGEAGTFTLTGTVLDAGTGEVLQGIVVDVYRIDMDVERELVFTGNFFSGNMTVPLKKGLDYQVVINRLGYLPGETFLEPNSAGPGQTEVERNFALQKAAEVIKPPTDTVALPKPQVDPFGTVSPEAVPPPAPANAAPAEEPQPAASQFGTYLLTGRTSLREGPTHTTGVILRFQAGDRVEVLEKTDQWWWRVRFGDKTGYVKAELLEAL